MLAELCSQFFGPLTQPGFVKVTLPAGGSGKFAVHNPTIASGRTIANLERWISARFISVPALERQLGDAGFIQFAKTGGDHALELLFSGDGER